MHRQLSKVLVVLVLDLFAYGLRYALDELLCHLPSIQLIINIELQELIFEQVLVLGDEAHLEVLDKVRVFFVAAGMAVSVYQKLFVWNEIGLKCLFRLGLDRLLVWMEVVIDNEFI